MYAFFAMTTSKKLKVDGILLRGGEEEEGVL